MLETLSETVKGLMVASDQLRADAPSPSQLKKIIARGDFRPAEDEAIGFWFARFLTTRENLWTVIDDVRRVLDKPASAIDNTHELRLFVIGYAAVCLLVRIDRLLLFDVAEHSLVQRKLNEAFPEYRIPRKQYTTIFSGFVDQANVLAIRDAMHFANKNRRQLQALGEERHIGFIVRQLADLEASLNPSKLSHLKRAWSYVSHKWRRRGVVSVTRVFAAVLEGFGRVAAEISDMENKRVTGDVLDSIAAFLRPGDVIITRHKKALTNLFFPGYWPHAALFIGAAKGRHHAGIAIDEDRAQRWIDDICVLEARKDGVRLRPLYETLIVDAFVVLRPALSGENTSKAIERALVHEGKKYNFDFDFFNSDRIVCTELIYRAFDGLDEMKFPLRDRAGRKTFSAEDFLDYALDTGMFEPVAIFGTDDSCIDRVMVGEGVQDALAASYQKSG